MDLVNDELDYEEDELEDDSSLNNSVKKNQEEKTKERQSLSGSDDLYLQLDCPEEEDFGFDEPSESVGADTQSVGKGEEGSEKSVREKSMENEQVLRSGTQKNGLSRNNECSRLKNKIFQRRPDVMKGFGFSSLSPGFKIPLLNSPNVTCNNQNQPVPLLALNVTKPEQNLQPMQAFHKKFPRSPSLTGVNTHNIAQMRFKPFVGRFSRYLNKERLKSKGENGKIFSKNLGYKTILPHGNSICIGTQDQCINSVTSTGGFNSIYQINQIKYGANHGQNGRKVGSEQKAQFSPLKEGEKKLLILKKEARLKRFKQDDVVRKETKPKGPNIENESQNDWDFGLEYFQKLEEQKIIREKLLSRKGQLRKQSESQIDSDALPVKPDINKEWLLLKRNPFDANSATPSRAPELAIKQENDGLRIKLEPFDSELFSLADHQYQFVKKEVKDLSTCFDSTAFEFGSMKRSSCPVKFVRTVSKSLNELVFKNPTTGIVPEENELTTTCSNVTLPFIANKSNCQTSDFPTQIESQLNGCIVKVLNIPPSTTTNDVLALCSPIGIVKEVKLNFPKENSVVIRFAEPSCADNFFNLYHGQKMNDYFLNPVRPTTTLKKSENNKNQEGT